MDEKIIIKSKQANIKLISTIIAVIGLLLFVVVWISSTSSGFYHNKIANGDWGYVLTNMVPFMGSITILPFLVIAIGSILLFAFKNYRARKRAKQNAN